MDFRLWQGLTAQVDFTETSRKKRWYRETFALCIFYMQRAFFAKAMSRAGKPSQEASACRRRKGTASQEGEARDRDGAERNRGARRREKLKAVQGSRPKRRLFADGERGRRARRAKPATEMKRSGIEVNTANRQNLTGGDYNGQRTGQNL